ncbi:hypothetical protein HAP32_04348 [Serratia fonticola]|nr:hypothetical protein HAP32_04348 [Serratia fonticola]
MPWDERSAMSLRTEFVLFASQEGANIRALCRQFGIAPATAYKWLHRWQSDGRAGLNERSRVPHHSPSRTPDIVVQYLRAAHQAHPMWGARKLKRWLEMQGIRYRPPAPCITSCATMTCYRAVRHQRPPSDALNMTPRTDSGRWTLKATSPSPKGVVIR